MHSHQLNLIIKFYNELKNLTTHIQRISEIYKKYIVNLFFCKIQYHFKMLFSFV